MITFGVDAHKATHTIVAVTSTGCQVGVVTVPATAAGLLRLMRWASQFGERRWAIEDCRPVTRRLERDLLAAGERAVRVPPMLMAQTRRSVRTPGKSDAIDGLAIARACLENSDLPQVWLDGPERIIRLLSDRREGLVAEKTRLVNRIRWRLHELDPQDLPPRGALNRRNVLGELTKRFTLWASSINPVIACLGMLGLNELDRVGQLLDEIKHLDGLLTQTVSDTYGDLMNIVGVGITNAAAIIGHVANIDRFATGDKFAAFVGTAPIPASSGNNQRFRLNRGGDRQLNSVIHRIAITQLAHHQPAKNLVAAAISRGKTKREAIRILKRHITRAIYNSLKQDQQLNIRTAA